MIDEFDGFVVEDEGSNLPRWDTRDTAYRDKKTTPTEIEYCEIMEGPHPDVGGI